MKIADYLKLIRIPLFILSIIASISIMKYFDTYEPLKSLLILLAIVSGNISMNIYNEVFDVETDKILKPWKPIPSGRINKSEAEKVAMMSLGISLSLVVILGLKYDTMYLLIGLLGIISGIFYNALRYKMFGGNITLGTAYFSAALMCSYPHDFWFAVAFGLITISFNIAVQVQDIEGDYKAQLKTLPITVGIFKARVVSAVIGSYAVLILVNKYYPKTFSVVFSSIIFAIMIALYRNDWKSYEYLVRGLSRFLMIIGFILMFLGV